MECDEPILASASIDQSTIASSLRSALNAVSGTFAEGLGEAARTNYDEYEDDDDDDGVASVGRPAHDEDEAETLEPPPDKGPFALAAGNSLDMAPLQPLSPGNIDAMEAAMASLAVKQQERLRQAAEQTPSRTRSAIGDVATSHEPQTQDDTAQSATEAGASTSEAEEETTLWHTSPKHFFILSSAGKPIWSYNGDEKSLVGLTALISALVHVVQSHGDTIQHIRSGSNLITFMLQGPLYLVAASSIGEPATALRKQLELLHGQLVLVVTTGLERIIQRNPSYDVRSLLDGVGGVLSSLVALLAADASYLLSAYRPLPIPAADRAAITELLSDAVRQSGAVYGLLMADTLVVAMSRAKQQPALHPDDMLLLANFVMCNNAYRHGHGEAFSPVCLPHYNSDSFLHAYIHYLDASSGLYLVLLSGSAEAFHQLSAARSVLEVQADARGLLPRLRSLRPPEHGVAGGSNTVRQQQQLNVLSVESLPRPLGGKFGHTPLWSYAVRFQLLQQAVFSPPCPLHRTAAGATRLAASYAQLHSLLHSPASPGRPNKLAWFADSNAVLVAARDREMELYLVCDPLADKPTAVSLLEALRRHFTDRGIAADVTLSPLA